MDSKKQDICDRDEEIRQLTNLLETKEMAGGGGGEVVGGNGRSDHEEEFEMSDLRAKLEEAEDRRMRAEEELKILQSRLTEREDQEKVVDTWI